MKRALAKLRVAADWRAPPARAAAEVDWFKLVGEILPDAAPRVIGEDLAHDSFAMEYLEPSRHCLWKAELAAGRVAVDFAARVGTDLAKIHAATAGQDDVARRFDHGDQFHALRIEPYLLFTAGRHPDVAPRIRAIAQGIETARIALMQGDISPKNILIGPYGPVFLDAETASYGDPAFDAGFCLNHLLLKCVWHPAFAPAYLESFGALKTAYLDGADWEDRAGLEKRIAHILSALLLARIDGKSPVEYSRPTRTRVSCAARIGEKIQSRRDGPGLRNLSPDTGVRIWRWRSVERACGSSRATSNRHAAARYFVEAWITSELFTLATLFSAVTVSVTKLWNADRSARHAFEQEIHFARQHVAFAHFRPAAHPFLEMLEVGILLAGQADKDEAGDRKAQRLAVQDRRDSPG